MGTKKTTTTKTAAPAKRAAKPAPTVKLATAAKRPEAKKPAAPRKRATPKAKTAKAPAFTQDDIALRAYFVSEKRHAAGLPGDAHSDWLEAERQLLAEHS